MLEKHWKPRREPMGIGGRFSWLFIFPSDCLKITIDMNRKMWFYKDYFLPKNISNDLQHTVSSTYTAEHFFPHNCSCSNLDVSDFTTRHEVLGKASLHICASHLESTNCYLGSREHQDVAFSTGSLADTWAHCEARGSTGPGPVVAAPESTQLFNPLPDYLQSLKLFSFTSLVFNFMQNVHQMKCTDLKWVWQT